MKFSIFRKFSLAKLGKRERYFVYLICVLLILFLLNRFIFQSIANTLKHLNEETAKQELIYKRSLGLVSNREDILSYFENYKKYLSSQKESIRDSLPQILSYLESSARKNNVTVIDVKPKKKVTENVYSFHYSIELALEAGLSSILDFFYELNKGNFLIDTKEVSIGLKEDTIQLKVELESIIFK